MSVLLTVGLVLGGFVALLGTFALVSYFSTSPISASILLTTLTLISMVAGPLYDLLLWTVIQTLVTIIWYLFFPSDPYLATQGILGPLVLLAGVVLSSFLVLVVCCTPLFVFAIAGRDGSLASIGIAAGLSGACLLVATFTVGKRIDARCRMAMRAIRSIEERARR